MPPTPSMCSTASAPRDKTPKDADKAEKRRRSDERDWEVKPVRALAPGRKPHRRGSVQRIRKKMSSSRGRAEAAKLYEDGKLAPGSRRAYHERVAFWERRARAHGLEPWPLDVERLKLLGALLHAGSYRGAGSYFAAAKRHHVDGGGDWTTQMAQEVRDGIRSCTRGQGPAKQSAELDLDVLANTKKDLKRVEAKWPIAGVDAVLVQGFWLTREIEAGTARISDVEILEGSGCGRAAWELPCSKTDPRALGQRRVHGCSCPDKACPTAAMQRVREKAAKLADKKGLDYGEAPLLPDASSNFVEKVHMVAFFQEVGKMVGKNKGLTGHMPRVSGARRMARAGIELWQIQLFARWESAVILRYVREAPLSRSHLLASRLAGKDLAEMIDDKKGSLTRLKEMEGEALDNVLSEKLGKAMGSELEMKADKDGDKLFDDLVAEMLDEKPVIQESIPYIINGRSHHSLHRVHRPRDARAAFCGWGWAAAVAAGNTAEVAEGTTATYRFCEICAKGAAARIMHR